MPNKNHIMFMQSQDFFGSDSMIHSLMMRYFNRDRLEVHAACNLGTRHNKSASLKALEQIPDLHLRPTNFGPTVHGISKLDVLKQTVSGVPSFFSIASLAWYIKKNKIKIIHGTEKPRDAFYGVILAKLTGAKSVIHMHVKCEDWISPLVRWAMGRADMIIGVSDFVAQSVIAKGYSADKVSYALNSLDASKWDYNIDGSEIRKEFGIAPTTPILAIISRLFVWKGHTELIKALAKVKETTSDFKLLIVGEDDDRATPGRGSFMAELKALTKELELDEQIIFTGFRKDIARLLAASDIFAMPSFEEPCAVAYLEAMAMKKPVIAITSGGTPQLVDQGKAGLLSEPYNIEELAANILTLLNNPELRREMGEYARKRVEEYYNPKRMAEDVEKIYETMLK